MRLENDDNFNFLYNEAYEKIPRLFKFSQRRYKAALIIMLVCFGIILILTTVFYSTAKTEIMPSLLPATTLGSYKLVNTYEYGWLALALVFAGIVALIGAWMLIARALEKRAFRKAADLNNRIFLAERHRVEMEWQNWKMNNRDY